VNSGFWASMRSYSADNYTFLGILFAVLGLILVISFYNRDKQLAEKFILAYGAGTILFIVFITKKLASHSYHQYPFAPLLIILMAYAFVTIGNTLGNFFISTVKENKDTTLKVLKIGIITVLLLLVYFGGADDAIDRQFDTQFLGLDVAGDYIRENSNPDERVIFSSGQSYGVLWHADRKGYDVTLIKTVEDFKEVENQGVTWYFVYQWGLADVGSERWNYMSQNYELKQVGFMNTGAEQQLT